MAEASRIREVYRRYLEHLQGRVAGEPRYTLGDFAYWEFEEDIAVERLAEVRGRKAARAAS